jgi:hypothetical protein
VTASTVAFADSQSAVSRGPRVLLHCTAVNDRVLLNIFKDRAENVVLRLRLADASKLRNTRFIVSQNKRMGNEYLQLRDKRQAVLAGTLRRVLQMNAAVEKQCYIFVCVCLALVIQHAKHMRRIYMAAKAQRLPPQHQLGHTRVHLYSEFKWPPKH